LALLSVFALVPVLPAAEDGEIMDASIVLTVSPDYKVKEEVSITKRLISYQSLDTDGDPRTPYCGDLQILTITRARVTTPGGKVVDCTPNALNLSTPYALVAHPALSGWQEMVVTFLGLEPGAQTELSYVREDKVAFRTTFEKKQILAWHFPIRKGTVTVRLPKNIPLAHQMMNMQGEASTKAVGDHTEYIFAFKDIPAFSDRDLHGSGEFLPALYLTTTPSWKEAGMRLADMAEKYGSPDEAIKKKATELTKDAMTNLDKAISIHKFIKENFKEVEWPLQDSLLMINDAPKTFATGQGTDLELALLLRAMLKTANLENWLSLFGPLPIAENAPGLVAFDRVMVCVEKMYLDPAQAAIPEPSRRALLAERSEVWETWSLQSVTLNGEIEVSKDGLKGSATIIIVGELNPFWKNLEEEGALEAGVKSFLPLPNLKIEQVRPKELRMGTTQLEVKFSGKLIGGERIIRLLPETKVFLAGIDSRVTSTNLPVRLPFDLISIKWTIKGAGKVESMELKPVQRKGEITIIRRPTEEGFTLEAKMRLGSETLAPADYPALQAALAALQNPVVAGILLPEGPGVDSASR
jgi:hypothetical protein